MNKDDGKLGKMDVMTWTPAEQAGFLLQLKQVMDAMEPGRLAVAPGLQVPPPGTHSPRGIQELESPLSEY